jgi:hypothetical protein
MRDFHLIWWCIFKKDITVQLSKNLQQPYSLRVIELYR